MYEQQINTIIEEFTLQNKNKIPIGITCSQEEFLKKSKEEQLKCVVYINKTELQDIDYRKIYLLKIIGNIYLGKSRPIKLNICNNCNFTTIYDKTWVNCPKCGEPLKEVEL